MSRISVSREERARWRTRIPELKALPQDWDFRVTSSRRICFFKSPSTKETFDHPALGSLPEPWIFRSCTASSGKQWPRYMNMRTNKGTDDNPRYFEDHLEAMNALIRKDDIDSAIAGCFRRLDPSAKPLEEWVRQDIGDKDIRDKYIKVKDIDPGDGSIGGMNGGVFIVKLKADRRKRYQVEKRFKPADVGIGSKEIKMLHRLKHSSLTFYTNGFIIPERTTVSGQVIPAMASVYAEFCQRGSLENLIKAYIARRQNERNNASKSWVPERFIWHALAGLCDGLAYLAGGRSLLKEGLTDNKPDPKWIPILHRDIKPDNILLRERDTLGSQKYFYCVLSDFGLACENRRDTDLEADRWQKSGNKLGTKTYWAPELCYNPYPGAAGSKLSRSVEMTTFPNGKRHSRKSDLWALGACIYNLADCDPPLPGWGAVSHLQVKNKPPGLDSNTWIEGTQSRRTELKIPDRYSSHLREAVALMTAWDPDKRASAHGMISWLKEIMPFGGWQKFEPKVKADQLPEWATKKHEYDDPPQTWPTV